VRIGTRRERHGTVRLTGAVAAAMLFVLAIGLPAMAAQGPTRLLDPNVSPGSGTTASTFTVSVLYRSQNDSPADFVKAKIGATTYTLSRTTAPDWKKGVRFSWSGKLPAGTHTVTFLSRSKDKFAAALAGGSIVVTVPPPKPTPEPTPKPAPRATAEPTPIPRPVGQGIIPRATPEATPSPRLVFVPPPTPLTAPTGAPTGAAIPDPTSPDDTPSPSDDWTTVAGGSTSGSGGSGSGGNGSPSGSGGTDGSGTRGAGGSWGPISNALASVGLVAPALPPLALAPTLATTSGIVVTAMAFTVFGRRRRDGDPPAPDEVLAAEAALGISVAMAGLTHDRPGPHQNAGAGRAPTGVVAAAAIAGANDAEAAMPRWRRPSLLEARKADPIRDAAVAPRLSFDRGLVGPLDGRERRLIRYNVVRLLDVPDELRGIEIGFLDQGDEVQLLERQGTYWLVLCPNGGQGWIHKMTLGEVVPDEDTPVPNGATATMPNAADTWTMGDDVDDDVLSAYIKSRERRD